MCKDTPSLTEMLEEVHDTTVEFGRPNQSLLPKRVQLKQTQGGSSPMTVGLRHSERRRIKT
jgi:hypothetical protein